MSAKPAESMDSESAPCAKILQSFYTLSGLARAGRLSGCEDRVREICRGVGHEIFPVVGMDAKGEELLRRAEQSSMPLTHRLVPQVMETMRLVAHCREAVDALSTLGTAVEKADEVRNALRDTSTCNQIRGIERLWEDIVPAGPPDVRATAKPVVQGGAVLLQARPAS